MVRPRVVTLAALVPLVAVLAPPAPAWARADQKSQAAAARRPFEALLPRVMAAAPGTYVIADTSLVPAPASVRIPMMLQADVLRGPERAARVGVVVGATVSQAVDVRLRVSTVPASGQDARVVADVGGSGTPGAMRLVRELSLPPGDYDLLAVVGPSRATEMIVAIAKSRLTVPDIRAGALAVTPIVAGEATTTTREGDVPFIFGKTTLTPAVSPGFSQDGAISVAFRIYNWTAKAEEKPDLTAEYLFYEQGTKGLHFFNKVKPQQLTAETLGKAFDPTAGSVAAGMMIPMQAFTFGEFQLVVKVTDNRNQQTAEQRVRFTVAP